MTTDFGHWPSFCFPEEEVAAIIQWLPSNWLDRKCSSAITCMQLYSLRGVTEQFLWRFLFAQGNPIILFGDELRDTTSLATSDTNWFLTLTSNYSSFFFSSLSEPLQGITSFFWLWTEFPRICLWKPHWTNYSISLQGNSVQREERMRQLSVLIWTISDSAKEETQAHMYICTHTYSCTQTYAHTYTHARTHKTQ